MQPPRCARAASDDPAGVQLVLGWRNEDILTVHARSNFKSWNAGELANSAVDSSKSSPWVGMVLKSL
jgi:hypothetical protein